VTDPIRCFSYFLRAEEEFLALGPITRVEFKEEERVLSGAQVLRRTVAELSGLTMNSRQIARGALHENDSRAFPEQVSMQSSGHETLLDLFEKLKSAVPAELQPRIAHILVNSEIVIKSGNLVERRVLDLADEYVRQRELDKQPRTLEEAATMQLYLQQFMQKIANPTATR
jgi:hypothetical protein